SGTIFNRGTCLRLMAHLLECNGSSSIPADNDIDIIEFTKVYLTFEDTLAKSDEQIVQDIQLIPRESQYFYQRYNWPMLTKNFALVVKSNPILELFKIVLTLNHLAENDEYKRY